MTRGMIQVELVEDDGPEPDVAREPRPPRRPHPELWRRVRRLAPVVAAAIVVTLIAGDARERSRAAELAALPGVIDPVGPDLEPLWTADLELIDALWRGPVVDGTVVAVVVRNRTPHIVGVDVDTGDQRWTTRVVDTPGTDGDRGGMCWQAGAVAVCVVVQGSEGSLAVVDPADGRLLRNTPLDLRSPVATVGDLVLITEEATTDGEPQADRPLAVTWRVRAEDAATGNEAWSWTTPPVTVTPSYVDGGAGTWYWRSLESSGDGALFVVGDHVWLLAADGSVRRDAGLGPQQGTPGVTRTGGLVRQRFDANYAGPIADLLLDDRTWRSLPGELVVPVVDDGSVSDLLLVHEAAGGGAHDALVAVDGRTGDEVWRHPGNPGVVVLLDGRLYSAQGSTLVALDAATGETVWHRRLQNGTRGLTTDGQLLLTHDWGTSFEAYALEDGHLLWRADREGEVPGVASDGSVLVGAVVPHVVLIGPDMALVVVG